MPTADYTLSIASSGVATTAQACTRSSWITTEPNSPRKQKTLEQCAGSVDARSVFIATPRSSLVSLEAEAHSSNAQETVPESVKNANEKIDQHEATEEKRENSILRVFETVCTQ